MPNGKKLNVSAAQLKDKLAGQTLKEIKRVGKELHLDFKDGDVLALHLMLHGQLFLDKERTEHKHAIIQLVFDNGECLTMADYQGAATPTLNPPAKEAPDALAKEVDYSFWKEKLAKTRSVIKNVLLDQNVVRGIGNAYADEILWEAGISPFSPGNKIPEAAVKKLAKAIRDVLEDAEKQIIKSNPDIISGEVRDFLKIHNARKTHSPTGAAIYHKVANSRKTYYTDEQELYS